MNVLVVEDEVTLREGLIDLLRSAGHTVEAVGDGEAAVLRGTASPFDLVVLDLMLPKLDGFEVCSRLRRSRPQLPILMLTARGSEDDKVRGLKTGADDYVTKPFGARELLARIDALARRTLGAVAGPETIEIGDLAIDLGRCEIRRNGAQSTLTPREAGILRVLYEQRARAVPRAELLERVWGMRGDLQTRTVDMAIVKLRQKIESDPAEPRIVLTVTGVGYAWGAR